MNKCNLVKADLSDKASRKERWRPCGRAWKLRVFSSFPGVLARCQACTSNCGETRESSQRAPVPEPSPLLVFIVSPLSFSLQLSAQRVDVF